MGGADAVLAKARASYAQGDYRWVAQIVNQLVFAEPGNQAARQLQAAALEQLGYQSENSTWRNAYLSGAQELRQGVAAIPSAGTASPDLVKALTVPMFFDYLGVRLNADKAAGKSMTVNWVFTDLNEQYAMTLNNSALTYRPGAAHADPTATLRLSKAVLTRVFSGREKMADAIRAGDIAMTGDRQSVASLFGMLDSFSPNFNIVTPLKQ
jgi:alkyl sulfatase BDS1-like metallo-beta-lactamase superfamily hydrolase